MYNSITQSRITINHELNGRTVIDVVLLADDQPYVHVHRASYNREFYFPLNEVDDFEMHLWASTLPVQKLTSFVTGANAINMNNIQFGKSQIAEMEFIEQAGKYMRNSELLDEQTQLPQLIQQFINEHRAAAESEASSSATASYQQKNLNDDDNDDKINIFGTFKVSSTTLIVSIIVGVIVIGFLCYFFYFRNSGILRRFMVPISNNNAVTTSSFMDMAKYGAPPSQMTGASGLSM
jgi:hypothetical protein